MPMLATQTGGLVGLINVTIGEIDPASSRLMLYEKLSLTASDGTD